MTNIEAMKLAAKAYGWKGDVMNKQLHDALSELKMACPPCLISQVMRLIQEIEKLTYPLPVAIVEDPYDTNGLQWLCRNPPPHGTMLYVCSVRKGEE